LPDIENAFKDYIHVFCDCIRNAEPLTDQETLAKRDRYMEKYIADYINNDVGGAPLRSHFGKDWGERYMKDFFFAP